MLSLDIYDIYVGLRDKEPGPSLMHLNDYDGNGVQNKFNIGAPR